MFDSYNNLTLASTNSVDTLYHTKKRRIIQSVSGLVLLVLIAGNLSFANKVRGQNNSQELAVEIIKLTNQERAKNNLAPLAPNAQLLKAALAKADKIFAEQYFSHNSLDGIKFSTWVKEEDYRYLIIGENLALGFDNPKVVIKAWMDSPDHRANILNPRFRDIGLVVMESDFNGEKTKVIVQYFGATANTTLSENLYTGSGFLTEGFIATA
jgi:uncharacterized protein YkwD